MLILTRRPVESLHIGDEITVQVLGVQGNAVRFGITAPRHIPVHRKEIYEKIQEEQRSAEDEPDE